MKKKKRVTHNTKKLVIKLNRKELTQLSGVISQGVHSARSMTRARILLLSHEGKTNARIVEALGCAPRTVTDVRMRYLTRGTIDTVLNDAPRPGQPKKVTLEHETFVTAIACTEPPPGHSHWTLDELKKVLVSTYDDLDSISPERVRHILLGAALKPWREKNVVRSESHAGVSSENG